MNLIPYDSRVTCAGCGSATHWSEVPHVEGPDVLEVHTCPECGLSFEGIRVSDQGQGTLGNLSTVIG